MFAHFVTTTCLHGHPLMHYHGHPLMHYHGRPLMHAAAQHAKLVWATYFHG